MSEKEMRLGESLQKDKLGRVRVEEKKAHVARENCVCVCAHTRTKRGGRANNERNQN